MRFVVFCCQIEFFGKSETRGGGGEKRRWGEGEMGRWGD
tara:strand:- start:29509 stop:29625 length:117 start_codon:yes stop_codon:yes gene_type:complete